MEKRKNFFGGAMGLIGALLGAAAFGGGDLPAMAERPQLPVAEPPSRSPRGPRRMAPPPSNPRGRRACRAYVYRPLPLFPFQTEGQGARHLAAAEAKRVRKRLAWSLRCPAFAVKAVA